jgi:hypothetical protein
MDPSRLTFVNWSDTTSILLFIWLFVAFVVIFATFMLLAHAMIPSLLETGHIPEGFRSIVRKQRIPLYLGALLALGMVCVWLTFATDSAHELRRIWSRDWI